MKILILVIITYAFINPNDPIEKVQQKFAVSYPDATCISWSKIADHLPGSYLKK